MRIKAALFDIDGTLVDSNDFHVSAWQEAFASIGEAFDREAIHHQVGKGGDMLVPSLLPSADERTSERARQAHSEIFQGRYLRLVKPFPGARELLARVHESGRKVVLASSAAGMELEHYLDLLEARDLVSATTSADEVAHTKPEPDIFTRALEKIRPTTSREAIVVGDSPYDLEAATRCGLTAVGLRSGKFEDHVLHGAGAAALYDDAAALLARFETSILNS